MSTALLLLFGFIALLFILRHKTARRVLIRASVVALALAWWDLYGKDMVHLNNNLHSMALGYFSVLLISYVIAWWVVR